MCCKQQRETDAYLIADVGNASDFTFSVYILNHFALQIGKTVGAVLGNTSTSGTRNLTSLALSNYLRGLGFARETDIRRVVDIVMNPNSLYGTKGGKQPINPYVGFVSI